MMTRRIMEGIIVVSMLVRPVFGSMRLWGVRTMQQTPPGTFVHGVAEVVTILT